MIIRIGNVSLTAVEVEEAQRVVTPHWGTYRPIASNPHYHNTQGHEERMMISGKFISDATARLTALDDLARSKRRTRITLATGESMPVIVESVQTSRQKHLDGSGAVMKDYSITLVKAGGGGSILSIIGAILGLL